MNSKEAKIITAAGILSTVVCTAICIKLNIVCGIICGVLGIGLTVLFTVYTAKRYKKLWQLNNYLSAVCAGNYNLSIGDNTEGELSILKNNLYKVIVLLNSQNDELKKEKTFLSDSMADISHQLKTPLTSMMVMSDLLLDETDENKRKEFLSIITTQLDKIKWLITNLLKISKLDAGTTQFKKEDVSINDVLTQSLKPFGVTLDIKQIKVINTVEDFIFKGDSNWTCEAVENIIKNCIEHTNDGGTLTFYTQMTNIYNSLFIVDNGCGITKEDLPHIFERFYHGENSSSESVGIGLALAKTVLEKEKGDIIVSSKIGEGSKFEVRFYKAII